MSLPNREEMLTLLDSRVGDEYQRYHGRMVGAATEGYAALYDGDKDLWYATGLLHDIDFEEFPHEHPAKSLAWFKEWGYPEELIQAVEAHAYGYNGFTTLPVSKLDGALMACDEMSGIFYAYHKLNPVPYGEMKVNSMRKRFNEKAFAAKIDRGTILRGCEVLGMGIDEHIENMIRFFKESNFGEP